MHNEERNAVRMAGMIRRGAVDDYFGVVRDALDARARVIEEEDSDG